MSIYLVEEMYELVEAIESGDPRLVCEELGDVLFHIVFLSGLFEENGHFTLDDAADLNRQKMTRRHPHVFGNESVQNSEEVRQRWHQIKMTEKKTATEGSLLDSVPSKMPALMRAYRVSERVGRYGFDWDDISEVIQKAEEEWLELKSELSLARQKSDNQEQVALEFGDVMFTLVNVARFARIHPETALNSSLKKFEKRFQYMEKVLSERGDRIDTVSRQELEHLWELAKEQIDS